MLTWDIFSHPVAKVGLGATAIIGFVAGSYWLFRNRIRRALSHDAIVISKQVITSDDLHTTTQAYIMHMLNQPATISEASNFIMAIVSGKEFQCKVIDTLVTTMGADSVQSGANQLIITLLNNQNTLTTVRDFMVKLINDTILQTAVHDWLAVLLNSPPMQQQLAHTCSYLLQSVQLRQQVSATLQSILADPLLSGAVSSFFMNQLKNEHIVRQVYQVLRQLLMETSSDIELNRMLLEYLSKVLMDSLNEPVNEQYIKTKIITLLTADDIMDSVSDSLIEVAKRPDIKKTLSESAVDSFVDALKIKYPTLFKWL